MIERDVIAALRALADATPGLDDPEMEARLEAAFSQHRIASNARVRRMDVWWAAAAVLVLACSSAAWWLGQRRAIVTAPPSLEASTGGLLSDFVALPGAAALPEFERGDIVRIEVPLVSLPAYGIEIVPDATPMLVPADLLVGQDGVPRAIRIASDRFQ
jgi:hypothetical protein